MNIFQNIFFSTVEIMRIQKWYTYIINKSSLRKVYKKRKYFKLLKYKVRIVEIIYEENNNWS